MKLTHGLKDKSVKAGMLEGMAMITRQIAIVNDCRSPVIKAYQVTFQELANWLGIPKTGTKDGEAWIPADIEPGPRNAARVKTVSFLVLDVEADAKPVKDGNGHPLKDKHGDIIKRVFGPEPPAIEDVMAELLLRGWRCFLHTSYSHCGAIFPEGIEHPRYRLIFDLSRPVLPNEIKPLGLYVAGLMGISDCIDQTCLDPARLFYVPRCPEERLSLFKCSVVNATSYLKAAF